MKSVATLFISFLFISHVICQTDTFSTSEAIWQDDFAYYHRSSTNQLANPSADLLMLFENKLNLCQADWDDTIQWECLGPFNSKNTRQMNQGRIDALSIVKYNQDEILAGGNNGGAWRTTDGGTTWHNTTDDEGYTIVGFHKIIRHPKNQKVVYAATGTALKHWNTGMRTYGVGVLKSFDSGETWTPTSWNPTYGAWQSNVLDIAIDPRSTFDSTVLYIATGKGIYRMTGDIDADTDWTTIYEDKKSYSGPAIYGPVLNHDLEIDRYGNIFFCNSTGVFYHRAGSDTVSQLPVPIPAERNNEITCDGKSVKNPLKGLYDLEINRQGEIGLIAAYYYMGTTNNKCHLRWKPYYYCISKDSGVTWTDPQKLRGTGYTMPTLAINQFDANIFYYEGSGRQVYKSINGGANSRRLPSNRNHVDVRCLELIRSTYGDSLGQGDVIYLGNDGGVATSTDGETWSDITGEGLACGNYFGLAITQDDPEYIFCGAQDGSHNFYRNGEWYTTPPGGDNGDCLIDPTDKKYVYQSANGTFRNGIVQGNSWSGRGVSARAAKKFGLFPAYLNPANPEEVFIGGMEIQYKSTEAKKWETITHPFEPKAITRIAGSENNPSILYYANSGFFWNKKEPAGSAANSGGLFKATRKNGIWKVTDITNNLNSKCRGEGNCGLPQILLGLTTDPTNENRIWTTMGGFEKGKKVYMSENGGVTWTNVSGCLPNIPATSIVYEKGSNDGLYLGTEFGVFYKNASMDEWIYYAENGPKCMITDMDINYTSGELIVSTLGRGVWRVPLAGK